MKNFLIALLVFLVWSFFGLWLYSWLNPRIADDQANNGIVSNEQMISEGETPLKQDLSNIPEEPIDTVAIDEAYKREFTDIPATGLQAISETGDILFLYPEGPIITKNMSEVIIPENLGDFKLRLKTYMSESPDTELHISSQYSPGETISSPNLGIQRGRTLKDVLIKAGIPANRIVIKPNITQIAFKEDNTFRHSFSFNFKPLDLERIEALKKQVPESRTVYPTYSYQGIMVNEALDNLRKDVVEILKENPNLHLEVIGHTDNVGNAIDNYTKGLEYARQVRWYLVNKARIDRNKITAISKGESEAIASNGSAKGRDLNRRIEVKFYLDAND